MQGEWNEIFTPDFCDDDYTGGKTVIKSGLLQKWNNQMFYLLISTPGELKEKP